MTALCRRPHHTFLVGAVLFASACQVEPGAPDERAATSAVTNSTPTAAGTYMAVVALTSDGTQASCTGTLIAPRIVISAGHCVSGPPPMIYFGSEPAMGGLVIPGIFVNRHVDFGGAPPIANDVALILLERPAPPEIVPMPLYPFPITDADVGGPLHLVGFGSTGGMMPTFGVKREGIAKILDYEETKFRLTGDPSQTCAGDSGGPAFITRDGVEYIEGVTSSGDPACSMFGRDSRIDAYLEEFIRPFIAATEPGAADLGDRCYYTEQCASGTCITSHDDPRLKYCSIACSSEADCPGELNCNKADGVCRFPLPSPGVTGSVCGRDEDCLDAVCAHAAVDGPGICTSRCNAEDPMPCMAGSACVDDLGPKDRFACIAEETAGCGCAAGSSRPGLEASLFVLLGVAVTRRRRRR